jgi:sugar transferase (PEP-CTERM system associated)
MAKVLMQRVNTRLLALIAGESALILGAVAASAWARIGPIDAELARPELLKALLVAGVCQLCLYYGDLYNLRIVADRRELFVRLLQSLGATSIILGGLYTLFPDAVIGRGVFVPAALSVLALIVGWRLVFEWVGHRMGPRERLLLVGTNPAAVTLARELFVRKELGVNIVGFVDPDPSRVGQPVINPGVIGTIEDIPSIVRHRAVDRVVVSLADARGMLPMERLLDMRLAGVSFDHLASVYEEYTGKIAIENLRPSWLIFSPGFRKSRVLLAAKRAIDVSASLIGLVLALPIMALVAAAIKLSSPGPLLYHQKRVGQNGRIVTVHKFRSMRSDAEAKTGAVWAKANDDRVFPVGRFLRKVRLDELPQLWNVLKGEMSFVGPRPERPEFVEQLTQRIPFYGQRHVVKPGVTGWAQVRYAYGASVEDAMEKLQYDLFYIKNLSVSLDIYIILQTVKTVILRRGAQ